MGLLQKLDRIPPPYSTVIALAFAIGIGVAAVLLTDDAVIAAAGLGLAAGGVLSILIKKGLEVSDRAVARRVLGIQSLTDAIERAVSEKHDLASRLESATGDDIYKYVLLINVSSLEGYVAQTRLQAEQSFVLTKNVSIAGFVLIGVGVAYAVYITGSGEGTLSAAYLSSALGIVTEFISGVLFFLYTRTLQQINRFHDKLIANQQMALSLLSTGSISDDEQRDRTRMELARELMLLDTKSGGKPLNNRMEPTA